MITHPKCYGVLTIARARMPSAELRLVNPDRVLHLAKSNHVILTNCQDSKRGRYANSEERQQRPQEEAANISSAVRPVAVKLLKRAMPWFEHDQMKLVAALA